MTDMDVGVVGSHVARVTADLALQGEYTHARAISLGTQKMLHGQRYVGRKGRRDEIEERSVRQQEKEEGQEEQAKMGEQNEKNSRG